MAIGCSDADQKAEFYGTCCRPRLAVKDSDDKFPAACQLASYAVFNPDYQTNKVVAKLGSLQDYEDKLSYEDKDVETESSSSSSEKKKPTSSSQAPSSTWTPESSSKKSSSSSSQWTPSSSSWTPEATPSSSSQWVAPSSSSSQWTPEAAPSSSSSSEKVWSESSQKQEAAWTPSSSKAAEPAWTPSSSSSQAPAPSSNNGGGSSGDFTGQASWFTQNGNPGACGIYHSDSDYIVALQVDMVSINTIPSPQVEDPNTNPAVLVS